MPYKVPKLIYLDGLDGSGKRTISTKIKSRLEDLGKKVYVFDPPFYETATGQIVRDYLYNGYRGLQTRSLASVLYSFDRLDWLRHHYDEMFHSNIDIIIMNRGMLSSLFFNTTLQPQSLDDWSYLSHIPISNSNIRMEIAHTIFDFTDVNGRIYPMQLSDIRQWLTTHGPTSPDGIHPYYSVMGYMYHLIRTALIREHAKLLFELEVKPWVVKVDATTMMHPFANVPTVVLVPDPDFAAQNVEHRCQETGAAPDRNEGSRFLEEVRENIYYIAAHHDVIFGSRKFEYWFSESIISHIESMQPRQAPPISIYQLPLQNLPFSYPASSFDFKIIPTTENPVGQMRIQRDIDDIFAEVWEKLLGDNDEFPSPRHTFNATVKYET